MDEFQNELLAASDKDQAGEGHAGVRLKKPVEPVRAEIKGSKEIVKEKAPAGVWAGAAKVSEKNPGITIVIDFFCGLLIFGATSLFGGADNAADYYIDYENGTIPLGDLPIGSRVVDPSWEWEFLTGADYAYEQGDETKPVTWIIVAKDHYDGLDPHVTLLTEELIGLFIFDDSISRGSNSGSNHWGESSTIDATRGLRPWLNLSGIHSDEGFYQAFSEDFINSVLITTVPNREWFDATSYSTKDHVFIPTTTELGDSVHRSTYTIGSVYPYFSGTGNAKQIALLGGEAWWYF